MFIISETVQAMTIAFAVKIVGQKVYMTITSTMALTFIQGYKSVSNLTWASLKLQYIGQYLSYYIQTWHDGRLMDALMLMIVGPRSQWAGRVINKTKQNQRCMLSATISNEH